MKKSYLLLCILLITTINVEAQNIFDSIRSGNTAAAKKLIEASPGFVNNRDSNNRTPLHYAAIENNPELISFLIDKGADPEAKDAEQHTPLHLAVIDNRTNAAAALIRSGAKLETCDDYQRTALILCARERGQTATAKVLIDAGADVDAVDKFGDTSLSLAVWRGKKDFINLLLTEGAKIPEEGEKWQMLLYESASNGLASLFQKLIEKSSDLKPENNIFSNLIHLAAAGGSPEIVNILMDRGFNPSDGDRYGWTPLHYAARDGRNSVVSLLLGRGAAINARTKMGQSAYDVAIEREMKETAALLSEEGADKSGIKFPVLKGEYLGQKPPEDTAATFAPGIISSVWGLHSTAAFSPDGKEVYWAPMITYPGEIYSRGGLMMMKQINNQWSPPQWASFSGPGLNDDVPFFSSDGQRIYFISQRPLPGTNSGEGENIWYADRTGDGWSAPKPLDETVNEHDMHWSFSIDNKKNLYFAGQAPEGLGSDDIYVAYFRNGHYEKPQNLGNTINSQGPETTPFIAPDGNFLIYSKQYDLWISHKDTDGNWSEPVRLGPEINSEGFELCPYITSDGKYLFFLSTRYGESHAFWVKTELIWKDGD